RECQQMGYADAVSFGQPVGTCSIYAGSLCLNTRFTLSWQCRGDNMKGVTRQTGIISDIDEAVVRV
ncbi:YecR family lipoprotein, partial [Salmonella enterica subsp. enterica serovar Virginia]|nr:YecR family lipoprotein [Salmonella enterica subsp. enterica serovar Virginia]